MTSKESIGDADDAGAGAKAVAEVVASDPPVSGRHGLIDPNTGKPLYPKEVFEMMALHYDSWLRVLNSRKTDEGFLPFPTEEQQVGASDTTDTQQPIFNYSLLEALERANSDFVERLNGGDSTPEKHPVNTPESHNNSKSSNSNANTLQTQKVAKEASSRIRPESLLKEAEISYLRNRISDMIKQDLVAAAGIDKGNSTSGRNGAPPPPGGSVSEGFSLYDTRDEEGLHEGNCGFCDHDEGQDDYDIDEIDDDDFLYDYQPTHHIEVELNTAPTCDVHGTDGCDCPMYDDGDDNSQDGPSCEFTFEYDYNGKLVPTYSNVEEKLRLMNLQSELKAAAAAAAVGSTRLPALGSRGIGNELDNNGINSNGAKKSKNKKKKKKKKHQANAADTESVVSSSLPPPPPPPPPPLPPPPPTTVIKLGPYCCLFCEYEAFYGTKPTQLMKAYDLKLKKEMQRRQEIRRKLENAKLKALKKQQELRQKQHEQVQQSPGPREENREGEHDHNGVEAQGDRPE